MSFQDRAKFHNDSIVYVKNIVRGCGFIEGRVGIELADRECSIILHQFYDRLSLSYRYRPDMIAGNGKRPPFLIEVKSEVGKSLNFAIEAISYFISLNNSLENGGKRVAIAVVTVDLSGEKKTDADADQSGGKICAKVAWVEDICSPVEILCPSRPDRNKMRYALRNTMGFGGVLKNLTGWGNGSGTPYFLVPKMEPYWEDLGVFLSKI